MPTIQGTDGDTTGALVTTATTATELTALIEPASHTASGAMTPTQFDRLALTPTEMTAELDEATNTLPGLMPAKTRAGDKTNSDVVLTDADATIQPFTDGCSRYVLPAGTLTGNRVLTLGIVSAFPIAVLDIVVLDTSVHTFTIKNNAGTTIFTKGASDPAKTYEAYVTGGDWIASTAWFSGV